MDKPVMKGKVKTLPPKGAKATYGEGQNDSPEDNKVLDEQLDGVAKEMGENMSTTVGEAVEKAAEKTGKTTTFGLPPKVACTIPIPGEPGTIIRVNDNEDPCQKLPSPVEEIAEHLGDIKLVLTRISMSLSNLEGFMKDLILIQDRISNK